MIKLLVVDDSALMRRVMSNLFAAEGDFTVALARDGLEALARLDDFAPDVITLDVQMPHLDGLACLDRIMLSRPCPVVMLSGITEESADIVLAAMELGAVDFVPKPGGAISLSIHEFGPRLVSTVRAAARARVRRSRRLVERLRMRSEGASARSLNGARARPAPRRDTTGRDTTGRDAVDRVVLVGCSTGGPPALDALLAPLPADFPWPILIAQHMPQTFTAALARRLDRLCALSVQEVTRPVRLAVGQVYVGRGDADIILDRRPDGIYVAAAPALPEHLWHPSVDRLVASALRHREARSLIGILMTGMGNDGARAMAQLRAEGGHTIAEAEESAVVWGMPGELVRAGGAEIVAQRDDIAARLLAWAT